MIYDDDFMIMMMMMTVMMMMTHDRHGQASPVTSAKCSNVVCARQSEYK